MTEPLRKQWYHEPLLHFMLLGALMFFGYALVSDDRTDSEDNVILVTQADRQRLADAWSKQRGREPSAGELEGLVSEMVREEILYREALAMGLDKDDTIVRRRLAQKMEFLTEDLATSAEPDETALRAYFAENENRFKEPPTLSFVHVYINSDQRGTAAADAAATILRQLRDGASAETLGDRIMLESGYSQVDEQAVSRLFGESFAASLFNLDGDSWQGPVESGYGLHLVRIIERTDGQTPDFEKIADKILAEYRYEQREQANARVYAALREKYDVRIEDAG